MTSIGRERPDRPASIELEQYLENLEGRVNRPNGDVYIASRHKSFFCHQEHLVFTRLSAKDARNPFCPFAYQEAPTVAVWIGIDVSKLTLDVCIVHSERKPRSHTFANKRDGHQALLAWVERSVGDTPRHFCLEATGPYSQPIAAFLAEHAQTVSIVNPFRVKHAGMASGVVNKTDHADARLLAEYCRKEQPAVWRLCAPEVRTLTALMRRLEGLKTDRTREHNRLEDPSLETLVMDSIHAVIGFLDAEIRRLSDQIDKHIKQNPHLKEDRDLLTSIPGIGNTLAQWILAEVPDIHQFASAQSLSAYAGLNPKEFQSGSSIHRKTQLSKAGNARLRKALYLPAVAAIRFNPVVQALCHRLQARGLSKMASIGAAMRKLLHLAYGVLKHRRPFDPKLQVKAA